MKTKALSLIVVAMMAALTLGAPGDPNEPYVCEQEVFEGPFEAILRVVDVEGNYPGNEIGVEWLQVPQGITIVPTDSNEYLCDPMDICQFYKITTSYLTVGTKLIKRRQYDSVGNESWYDEIIIVKRLPDTMAPVAGCMSILSQNGGE